jgi:prepilin peptidase CpaA
VSGAALAAPDRRALPHPPRETALQEATFVLAIGAFAAAAWDDLWARRIPNAVPLAIGALALVQLIPGEDARPALLSIAAAAAVFVLALAQWRLGLLGGGDAKLLAAAALLVGWRGLFDFLFLTAVFGGGLALAVIGASRFGRPAALLLPVPGEAAMRARPTVPYGVAISAAAVWVLIQQYSMMK